MMKPVIASGEWRIWQQNAAPMPLIHTLNAGMGALRNYFGTALWTSVIVFEEGQGKWLFRPKELMLLGQKMIDFLMCPPYRVTFITGYESSKDILLQKTREIQFELDPATLGNFELVNLFDEFSHLYYEWYKYGWFCEPVQFQSQDLLQRYLEKDVIEKQPALDTKKAVQALFAIEDESFSIGILRHLAECGESLGRVLRKTDLGSAVNALRGELDFPDRAASLILSKARNSTDGEIVNLLALLHKHSEMFYWKQNNYFSTVFVGEQEILLELFASDEFDQASPAASIKAEIANAELNRSQLLGEKAEILELLTPYYKTIAVLATLVGGSLLDDRKKTIMAVNGAFDRLLSAAADRTGFALEDCRYLIPQELDSFLSVPTEYRDRLEERKKIFVVYQGDFGLLDQLSGKLGRNTTGADLQYDAFTMPDPFIAEGKQGESVLAQLDGRLNLFQGEESESMEKLQGVTAYFDETERVVEGRVRVVTDPKMDQAQRGEILVAPSTTPDYIASIRRCKAIITDWGGQTSHAATVARELQKPCIIATNYASQVLRTGDLVRLYLETGVVEIIMKVG